MRALVVSAIALAVTACSGGDNAIQRCEKTIEDLPNRNPATKARHMLLACKDIFAEKRCRKAWERAANSAPDKRIPTMFDGCRAAYCSKLGKPTPDACKPGFSAPSSSSFEARMRYNGAWSQLMRRALLRDLGRKDAERLAWQFNRLRMSVSNSVARRPALKPRPETVAAAPPKLTLQVTQDTSGKLSLELLGVGAGTDAGPLQWTLAARPKRKALAAAATAIAKHAGGAVALDTSKAIKYRIVYRVMAALRRAGVQRITVANAGSGSIR